MTEEDSKKKKKLTPAQEARIIEKGTKILEMRKAGASLRAISKALTDEAERRGESTRGFSYSQMKRDYDAIIYLRIDEQQETVDEIRALSAERLEEVLLHYMPYVRTKIDGLTPETLVRMKIKAGDLIIKATKELAELYGAKRPQKLEVTALRIGSRVQKMKGVATVDGNVTSEAIITSVIADRNMEE